MASLAIYFNATYPDRQVAMNEALSLFRSLVNYAGDSPGVQPPRTSYQNIIGQIKQQVGRWARRVGHSYTHDANGAYIGPLRGVAAKLLQACSGSKSTTTRSAHTYYDPPTTPLWPDWDFDMAKAQNAHLENDWPITNGWEQAMWGPFVGPVHENLSPRMQAIVQRDRKRRSRTALFDLLQSLLGMPQAPPTEPEPHLIAKRVHAERLLEWLAFSVPLDEAMMISDAFTGQSSGSPTQDDALWILGEHFLWGTHGATPNATRALECYARLAMHGNATAHARLGYLHSSAYATDMHQIPSRPDEALVHYALASQEKDWHAQGAMAYRYRHGVGVPKDCREALTTYDRMARDAYQMYLDGPPGGRRLPYTKIRLSDIHLGRDMHPFIRWSQRRKNNWLVLALRKHLTQKMVQQQPKALTDKKALQRLMEIYEDYALEDEPWRRYMLARSYYFGSIVADHEVLGAIAYDPVASAQHALALAEARWPHPPVIEDIHDGLYVGTKLRPVYTSQDMDWDHKEAAQAAASLLGLQYLRGEGVPQDFMRAKVWFTRAALANDTQGRVGLGWMYLNGYGGLTPNATKAKSFFDLAFYSPQVRLEVMKQAMRMYGILTPGEQKWDKAKFVHESLIYMINSQWDYTLLLDDSFEENYLRGSLYMNDYLSELNHDNASQITNTTNCQKSLPFLEEAVERADWNDPIYHRAAAAYDRGDLATALQAWSIAAEAGIEEAQDNMAFVLDQFTSWNHVPTPEIDDALALHYWAQSARQGSVHARHKICEYILFGLADGGAQRAANCFGDMVDLDTKIKRDAQNDGSIYNSNPLSTIFDEMSAWRLGSMYAQGSPSMRRDLALAKRLYDQANTMYPESTGLLMFFLMVRLFFQALWHMLQGDVTARSMLLSYLPSSLTKPWSYELISMAVELSLFFAGVLGLLALAWIRRYVRRRLTAAEAARTAALQRGPSTDTSTS